MSIALPFEYEAAVMRPEVGIRLPRRAISDILEFHHRVPLADGGHPTSANLLLYCRAHNAHEAEVRFGAWRLKEERAPYVRRPDRVDRDSRRRATENT